MESAIKNDFLLEGLWPKFNAVVTKLRENYIGAPGEKYIAQHHGFDRDFWAGSLDSQMTVIYRVHVKPRSAMFDPSHGATSLVPDGTQIVSRKTFLKDSRERRTAEIEHVCEGCLVSVHRGSQMDRRVYVPLGIPCRAESDAYCQRTWDWNRLHQAGRTIALATGSDHVSTTETVKLALGQI